MQLQKNGISVIICCFNSSKRISQVLYALSEQLFQTEISWEVILVDNASTDNTSTIASSIWDSLQTGVKLHVVFESRQGLAHARNKGIEVAAYEYLVFCDDDNWLYPDYLQLGYDILNKDALIVACGGTGVPVFEIAKPEWFDEYAEAFATGTQEKNIENGKIINLYGAGMLIRKTAIEILKKANFQPLMEGRLGNKLSSSEDTELTYALVLTGQTLCYSSALKFYHFLPKERLQFSYLKKLFIAFGNDGPIRNLYYANLTERYSHKLMKNWHFHFFLSLFRLFKYAIVPPKKWGRIIYYNWNKAYLRSLISLKGNYEEVQKGIKALKVSAG